MKIERKMDWKDGFRIRGKTQITLFDREGNIKDYRETENLITNNGFDFIARQIGGYKTTSAYVCGIGSDNTAANAADTTLGSELARVSGVFAHTAGTKTFTNTATFDAGVGTGNVYEAGLLNNESSDGTLLNRQTFGLVSKAAGDVLQVIWTISLD